MHDPPHSSEKFSRTTSKTRQIMTILPMCDKLGHHQVQNKSFSGFDGLRQAILAFDVDFRPLTSGSYAATLFQYIEAGKPPGMLAHGAASRGLPISLQ